MADSIMSEAGMIPREPASARATRTTTKTPVRCVKRAEGVKEICADSQGAFKPKRNLLSKNHCHVKDCSASTMLRA